MSVTFIFILCIFKFSSLWSFFFFFFQEPPKEDLTVSEKFQLVLDVAQKAQVSTLQACTHERFYFLHVHLNNKAVHSIYITGIGQKFGRKSF